MKKYFLQFEWTFFTVAFCAFTHILPAQALEINCINGLTVNLMNVQPPQFQLWASDFLESAVVGNNVKIALRKAGTGTGFPTNPDGTPQTGVSYFCSEIGVQGVELWARDQAGNTDFCESTFTLADIYGVCQFTDDEICVRVATEEGSAVEGVGAEGLGGFNWGQPMTASTDAYGILCVSYNPVWSANANITPTKESDLLNGVDAYDLYLISRHILGITPFNSPYKMIAADANKSGTITTFDIAEFQRLIQGIYSGYLPNNSSWRFVTQNQIFDNPQNPFAEVIFENVMQGNIDHFPWFFEFIGMKIGDVNHSVDTNDQPVPPPADSLVSGITDRNFPPEIYYFDAIDKTVAAGDVFTLEVSTNPDLLAWQFTLNLPNVEVLSVTPGTGLLTENFAVFPAVVTSAVYTPSDHFFIQLKANAAGTLSDWFHFNDDVTTSAGFIEDGKKVNIELRFTAEISSIPDIPESSAVTLYPNTPNPWHTMTTIPFDLPEATQATFRIMDETGKVLLVQTGEYLNGRNTITVDQSQVGGSGVYYYSITTAKGTSMQKMISF